MRGMKAKVRKVVARLKMNGMSWLMVGCLLADSIVLFIE